MFKKTIAALLCGIMTAGCLAGCGDTEKGESLYKDVANFTSPVKGEEVVVMNIKDYGEVRIKLFPEYADKGVENFIGLAKKGYYDGLTFHRVISDFMIQGGDPWGTGAGGESIFGDKFDGGTDKHLIHAAGAVAYANSGSTATNGSQFYIVTGEKYGEEELNNIAAYYGSEFNDDAKTIYKEIGGTPFLDGDYTVFGQVYEGLDIIFDIQNVETDENDKPVTNVIMESVTVEEYNGEDINWKVSE